MALDISLVVNPYKSRKAHSIHKRQNLDVCEKRHAAAVIGRCTEKWN
jgi:hypothetical protein